MCAYSSRPPPPLQDKQGIPWWLGISYKGIGQFDLQDKLKPRKVGSSRSLLTATPLLPPTFTLGSTFCFLLIHIVPLCVLGVSFGKAFSSHNIILFEVV